MFRWLGVALAGSLIIAVLALAVGGWRVQTAMADRLDDLAKELASLHQDQQQLLAQKPAQAAPEIRGRAFLGDESRPAADAEVQIWNASEMKLFRRLRTDRDGQFRSHSLPAGDYFVLAPLLAENGKQPYAKTNDKQPYALAPRGAFQYRLQSRPIYAYAGAEIAPLALDLQLRFGQVSFEFAQPKATGADANLPEIEYMLRVFLNTYPPKPPVPLDPNGAWQNHRWPLLGCEDGRPWNQVWLHPEFGGTASEPLETYPVIMPGKYGFAMMVRPNLNFALNESGLLYVKSELEPRDEKDYATFNVAAGKRTHLRITFPDELKRSLRELHGNQDETDLANIGPFPAAIEVVADQPLLPVEYVPSSTAEQK